MIEYDWDNADGFCNHCSAELDKMNVEELARVEKHHAPLITYEEMKGMTPIG